jgi:hypothetical protein
MGFAIAMNRMIIASILMLGCIDSANARDSLGIFEGWGAFRDPQVPRCYAIAEPEKPNNSSAKSGQAGWRAFAAISHWPRAHVRGQLHVRLSRQRAGNAPVKLVIGDRSFTLAAGNADAWGANKQDDAAIIGALRSSTSMSVETLDKAGRGFADTYDLRGVATAMDAAALGCAR